LITAVAIRYRGVTHAMVRPARHGDILNRVHMPGYETDATFGFMDADLGFLDRYDAWDIADVLGQILPDSYPQVHGVLYSENVW